MPEQTAQLTLSEQPVALDAMGMIQRAFEVAIENKQGLEVIDRLLAAQREIVEHQERNAYNSALARVQSKLVPIAKDADSPRGKYASAKSVDDAIESLCRQEQIYLSFNTEPTDKPDMVRLVCDATHGPYTKRYVLEVPADGGGPKGGGVMNRTQAVGSAVTSGKRYLKNMIFNLRFKDKEDNGMAAGGKQPGALDDKEHIQHLENIQNAGTGDELQRLYLAAQKAADDIGDTRSTRAFVDAKNARYRTLKTEGRIK